MKNLSVILIAVFFMFVAFGCADDTGGNTGASDNQADVSVGGDAMAEPDLTEAPVDTSTNDDSTGEEGASDTGDESVGVDVPEELPADPTENPDDSDSAFYSFPDWEVPSSSDDNR